MLRPNTHGKKKKRVTYEIMNDTGKECVSLGPAIEVLLELLAK